MPIIRKRFVMYRLNASNDEMLESIIGLFEIFYDTDDELKKKSMRKV